jgi:hypothetical protein
MARNAESAATTTIKQTPPWAAAGVEPKAANAVKYISPTPPPAHLLRAPKRSAPSRANGAKEPEEPLAFKVVVGGAQQERHAEEQHDDAGAHHQVAASEVVAHPDQQRRFFGRTRPGIEWHFRGGCGSRLLRRLE